MKSILFVGITENSSIRGVERVVFEAVKAFSCIAKNEYKIYLLCGRWQDYYKELENYNVEIVYAKCGRGTLGRHIYLWSVAHFLYRRYDVVHFMNTMPSLFRFSNYIFTVHDVAEFGCPSKYSYIQSLYRRLVLRWITSGKSKILTISNFSKNEIKKWCNINVGAVINNGLDHFLFNEKISCEDKFSNFGEYVLYFGVIEKTKGLDIAIDMFIKMKREMREKKIKMLIIGSKGNLFAEIERHIDNESIIYLGRLSDDDLKVAIKKSKAVLFFSEYEGFGMPAPESVAIGAKVIVQKDSVFHEICGENCISIDSKDKLAHKNLLEAINKNFPVDGELIKSQYSWAKSAEKMKNFYENNF